MKLATMYLYLPDMVNPFTLHFSLIFIIFILHAVTLTPLQRIPCRIKECIRTGEFTSGMFATTKLTMCQVFLDREKISKTILEKVFFY